MGIRHWLPILQGMTRMTVTEWVMDPNKKGDNIAERLLGQEATCV